MSLKVEKIIHRLDSVTTGVNGTVTSLSTGSSWKAASRLAPFGRTFNRCRNFATRTCCSSWVLRRKVVATPSLTALHVASLLPTSVWVSKTASRNGSGKLIDGCHRLDMERYKNQYPIDQQNEGRRQHFQTGGSSNGLFARTRHCSRQTKSAQHLLGRRQLSGQTIAPRPRTG